jgi:hypothetical protein
MINKFDIRQAILEEVKKPAHERRPIQELAAEIEKKKQPSIDQNNTQEQ